MNPPYATHPSLLKGVKPLVLAMLAAASAYAQAEVVLLGDLPGGINDSYGTAISGDGTTVVGFSGSGNSTLDAFRWTQAGGMVSIGDLPGGSYESNARGVNFDGSVVVGRGRGAGGYEAFRWTQAGGMVGMGDLAGGAFNSDAFAVSADGSVVVGFGTTASGNEAFRWTQAGGMVGLGDLAGGGFDSKALGVSADGNVVLGYSIGASGYEAFRWTQAGGMVGMGDLAGGAFESYAYAGSADGSVVVGMATSASGREAFRWTQAGGMVGLGDLPGGLYGSIAQAVSANGSVVVGASNAGVLEAFRWTQATGMQRVTDWLIANGVPLAPGFALHDATGVSADGNAITGVRYVGGIGEAYLARLGAPGGGGGGGGVILLSDALASLGQTARAQSLVLTSESLVLHGAHGRPLMRRVDAGHKAVWLSGDWGGDGHAARDGDIGFAEIGGAYNFGPAQLNLSLGQNWARQDALLNGRIRENTTHLLVEALVPLQDRLWMTLSGMGLRGDANIRRGYLNGGLPNTSTGTPDVSGYALRARLDWDSAVSLGGFSVSPYADVSHLRTRIDGYTETGGGFPARFNAQNARATDVRLGAHAVRPLQNDVRLVATLEAVRRLEGDTAAVSGELIGIGGFSLNGESAKRTWLRVGLGLEGKLGIGTGSLMLNGTTEGAAPNVWLAVNYQIPL